MVQTELSDPKSIIQILSFFNLWVDSFVCTMQKKKWQEIVYGAGRTI